MAYYKRFLNIENQELTFSPISKDENLKLFEDSRSEKVSGVDNLSERFLEDDANVWTLPMLQLCNLLLKLVETKFPLDSEIENHYTRKSKKQIQETIS